MRKSLLRTPFTPTPGSHTAAAVAPALPDPASTIPGPKPFANAYWDQNKNTSSPKIALGLKLLSSGASPRRAATHSTLLNSASRQDKALKCYLQAAPVDFRLSWAQLPRHIVRLWEILPKAFPPRGLIATATPKNTGSSWFSLNSALWHT